MDKGKDKSIPKSLPRRTWDATLHEQILHQREHARRIVANPGGDAGLSPAKTPDRSRRPRSE